MTMPIAPSEVVASVNLDARDMAAEFAEVWTEDVCGMFAGCLRNLSVERLLGGPRTRELGP